MEEGEGRGRVRQGGGKGSKGVRGGVGRRKRRYEDRENKQEKQEEKREVEGEQQPGRGCAVWRVSE